MNPSTPPLGDRLEASLEDRLQHSFSAARTTRSAVPESGPQVVQEPRHPDGLDHDLAGATPGAPPFSGRLAALQPPCLPASHDRLDADS